MDRQNQPIKGLILGTVTNIFENIFLCVGNDMIVRKLLSYFTFKHTAF